MLNFPDNPTVGTVHTVGVKTWQWNGYAWDLMSISESQVARAENAANTALEAAEIAGSAVIAYQRKGDKVSDTVVYRGETLPGFADNALTWRIRRITITYGGLLSIKTEWADGSKAFDHAWSLRSTYDYS